MDRRIVGPGEVALAATLDFDNFRAQVDQVTRAERRRDRLLKSEDLYSCERQAVCHFYLPTPAEFFSNSRVAPKLTQTGVLVQYIPDTLPSPPDRHAIS